MSGPNFAAALRRGLAPILTMVLLLVIAAAAAMGVEPYTAVMASIAAMLVLGALLLRWLPQPTAPAPK